MQGGNRVAHRRIGETGAGAPLVAFGAIRLELEGAAGAPGTTRGSFHAWFKTIVIHEALDIVKAQSKYTDSQEVADAEEIPVDNTALDRISIGEIMNMIQRLPPATHAVFVMYVVEGYNHREIAEQLNISAGTSKWHLSEARKSLKQQLGKNKT